MTVQALPSTKPPTPLRVWLAYLSLAMAIIIPILPYLLAQTSATPTDTLPRALDAAAVLLYIPAILLFAVACNTHSQIRTFEPKIGWWILAAGLIGATAILLTSLSASPASQSAITAIFTGLTLTRLLPAGLIFFAGAYTIYNRNRPAIPASSDVPGRLGTYNWLFTLLIAAALLFWWLPALLKPLGVLDWYVQANEPIGESVRLFAISALFVIIAAYSPTNPLDTNSNPKARKIGILGASLGFITGATMASSDIFEPINAQSTGLIASILQIPTFTFLGWLILIAAHSAIHKPGPRDNTNPKAQTH